MRILLSTFGSRGDVEPIAALAVQLQAMNAEVQVCAPPDEEFVALLARAGVPLVPAFSAVREWIATARQSAMALPELASIMVAAQYAVLDKAAEGCDAVVATGLFPSVAAAQCVAEKRGIPYVFVALYPLLLPSHQHRPAVYPGHPHPPEMTDARALWNHNHHVKNALFGVAVNGHRTAIGLPAVADVREHIFGRHPFLASDPTLWPWLQTDLCDPVETGAWILPDDRPLPAELEVFLDAGELPPVYIGFGSMAMPAARDAARIALDVVRGRGRRAVLARGWADLNPIDDRDDCCLVGDINQQALFRRVAAVVHHGGAGTTTTAARAGAPQVIVPQIVDQPHWAARVADAGIGAAHEGPSTTFESLSAAVDKALSADTRNRAAVVAAAIRTDGAAVAARRVLEAVASGVFQRGASGDA